MKLLFSIEQLQRRSLTSCLTHNMPRCKNNVSSSSAGQQKRNSRGQLKSIKVAVHKYMYVILYRLADMSQPTSPIIKRRTKHLFKNKLQDEDTDDIVIPGTPQKPMSSLIMPVFHKPNKGMCTPRKNSRYQFSSLSWHKKDEISWKKWISRPGVLSRARAR